MNLHEYQAKKLLSDFNVPIQRGRVVDNLDDLIKNSESLSKETGTSWYVVKAQIHAGGRGKGGGVKLAKNIDELKKFSSDILGMMLKTPQTPPEGKLVKKILITEDVYYPGDEEPDEFYFSILLNRNTSKFMVMYSKQGGMDIEQVAEDTPHLIYYEEVDPLLGLMPNQLRKIAFNLGLSGIAFKNMVSFSKNLFNAFVKTDASLVEINPVLKTSDSKILAVDAKMVLDDNSLFRHKDFENLRDISEENPIEVEAKEAGLNYVDLDGNIGCMVNGAGLAMATMDIIKLYGKEPANFLDVGGGASKEKVSAALKIILSDTNVKGILINIFGGIMRCDVLAQGVVDAAKEINIRVPLVVRLAGTNFKEGKEILDNSGVKLISAENLEDAAKKIVEVIK